MMEKPIFLTAEWRHLLMLNYTVDPRILAPLVPHGTELDFFNGDTFLSVVGFRFTHTRLRGIPIPLHSDFDEVNLRFYVRRKTDEGWRRGVVFVRELVPRWAIAFVARTFYGEPYSSFPMRHRVSQTSSGLEVEYAWRRSGRWESIHAVGLGSAQPMRIGSKEEFITEHYWGYTRHAKSSSEYQVEHPRWNVWPVTKSSLDADVATLYGNAFVQSLSGRPDSAFIADGSPIIVRCKSTVTP